MLHRARICEVRGVRERRSESSGRTFGVEVGIIDAPPARAAAGSGERRLVPRKPAVASSVEISAISLIRERGGRRASWHF